MAKPKTHITDPTKDAPEGAAWTLCGLFVLREQVDTADPSCKKLGQQHDFYLVQSGNLVPRAALWRGFLACFQQPSLLRPANLDSSDFPPGLCESGEFSTGFRVTLPPRFFGLSGHP